MKPPKGRKVNVKRKLLNDQVAKRQEENKKGHRMKKKKMTKKARRKGSFQQTQ